MRIVPVVIAALAATTLSAQQAQAPGIQWGASPPFFPAGARFAVLQGDPSHAGPYTVRLSMPAGYTIKPHFHPTDENITVITGTFAVGMGDSVDASKARRLQAGDFAVAPAQAHHFAIAQERAVVQVHGIGPFAITYVKAADDPRHTTATH
jgi:quercetin dioxygenase-like cupin family protein